MTRALGLFAAALALAACQPAQTVQVANLIGSHDVSLAGQYLFITSTDNNELRVLDLAPPNSTGRNFVRAPNPLEALSIPVLDRPTILSQDSYYALAHGGDGTPHTGSYVFATRAGAREISIVGASSTEFREVKRLVTSAPVTAIGGWLDELAGVSRLYFATFDGVTGSVFAVDLPDVQGLWNLDDKGLRAQVRLVVTTGGDPVAALLAVPPLGTRTLDGAAFCAGPGECLAVATRRHQGTDGRALLLDPHSLQAAPLAFPGPVRSLATHGCALNQADPADDVNGTPCKIRPGQRVFAILDEEKCGGPQCAGIVAVETLAATGGSGFPVALDALGQPMAPVIVGDGLPTGLSLAAGVPLAWPGSTTLPPTAHLVGTLMMMDVLGVATSSTGDIVFFDAASLTQFDADSRRPRVAGSAYRDPTGASQPYVNGPFAFPNPDLAICAGQPDGPACTWSEGAQVVSGTCTTSTVRLDAAGNGVIECSPVVLADGAWRSQSLVVTWEGVLPGFSGLPTSDAAGTHLAVPPELAGRARPQDLVVFSNAGGDCADVRVTAVQADGLDVDGVPAGCVGRRVFTVRAGGADNLVIQGTSAGYLGRSHAGGHFTYQGPYYIRVPGVFDPAAPTLTMDFGRETAAAPPVRGSLWQIDIDGAFAPMVSNVDTTSGYCNTFYFPGAGVYDPTRNRVFMAYPSANGVVELNPALVTRGLVSTGGNAAVICYR